VAKRKIPGRPVRSLVTTLTELPRLKLDNKFIERLER
jgi:hypothetical protein